MLWRAPCVEGDGAPCTPAVAAFVFLGAMALPPPKDSDPGARDDVIRARAFEVVNSQGRVVIRLSAVEEIDLGRDLANLREAVRSLATSQPSATRADSRSDASGNGVISLFGNDGVLHGEWKHGFFWSNHSLSLGKQGEVFLNPDDARAPIAVRKNGRVVARLGTDSSQPSGR